jgi:hypothetical protein
MVDHRGWTLDLAVGPRPKAPAPEPVKFAGCSPTTTS